MPELDIKEVVRERYAEAARNVRAPVRVAAARCGADTALAGVSPITSNLYADDETGALPEEAVLASLGCGNPTALAELKAGETVLDLGSGGGIDVLLSARRVGPTGKAYGLDMTDEMLALARENQREGRRDQRRVPQGRDREHPAARQFGRRDHLELRHQSLGRQGPRAARGVPRAEAGRPLRRLRRRHPRGDAGRMRRDMLLWVGCIAGALEENDYRRSSPPRGSRRSASSRRASTASRMRASSSPARASTWTPSRPWSTASS